jgi:hypothetical protein
LSSAMSTKTRTRTNTNTCTEPLNVPF